MRAKMKKEMRTENTTQVSKVVTAILGCLLALAVPAKAEQQAQSGLSSLQQMYRTALTSVPLSESRDVTMACISERFLEWGDNYIAVVDSKVAQIKGGLNEEYVSFRKKMNFIEKSRNTFEQIRPGMFSAMENIFSQNRTANKWPAIATDMTLVDPKLDLLAENMKVCHQEEYVAYILSVIPGGVDYNKTVAVVDYDSLPNPRVATLKSLDSRGFQGASYIPEPEYIDMSYFDFLDELAN